MPKDIIKSNKYLKTYKAPDVITQWASGVIPFVSTFLQKITNYQPPPEEHERVLDELPKPEHEIHFKKDE